MRIQNQGTTHEEKLNSPDAMIPTIEILQQHNSENTNYSRVVSYQIFQTTQSIKEP